MKRSVVVATPRRTAAHPEGATLRFGLRDLRGVILAASLVPCLASSPGCKSDLSQQLLERELRMQEDQIYQLQDELQDKCARLDRVAGENKSLKRQLGFSEADGPPARRGPALLGPTPQRALPSQPSLVPPAIDIPPPAIRPPAGGPAAAPALPPATPGRVAPPTLEGVPPTLEGVPPLPAEPRFPGAAAPEGSGVMPVSATGLVGADAADGVGPSTGPPLSREESLAVAGRITHLVVNPQRTECFDGNGDGVSDGIALVIEPRDGDERLVTAAGDVTITVFDAAAATGSGPVARWDIPAHEAIARFRRTSRNRGLHFVLRWPGPPPQGEHVRVEIVLTTFEAAAFAADCTVATGRQRPAAASP